MQWSIDFCWATGQDNQTWQTEWKAAPFATVQLCEYENQTLEVLFGQPFVFASLIVQWTTSIVHFQVLRMIVKLALRPTDKVIILALSRLWAKSPLAG